MKRVLDSGKWGKNHCQGFAVDKNRQFVYYSFTTKLIKCDINGTVVGSVDNIVGHLGCIDFCDDDGKLYASLEYKNDAIGRGILNKIGQADRVIQNGFYIAVFDVDKIDRIGMDAEESGVMRAVFLKTVTDDFEGFTGENGQIKHVFGCSGIDGLSIGPDFGAPKCSRNYLCVCYGIYSDPSREDNDYQVILQYDHEGWWDSVARPLTQSNMHESGPINPRNKYFLYTGNTTYGVQNLEYDGFTGDWFACVYNGSKPRFPNYPLFVIDGSKKAEYKPLIGVKPELSGKALSLKNTGLGENGIFGMDFPLGSTGFYSFGNGQFYVSEPYSDCGENGARVSAYKLNLGEKWSFTPITTDEF